MDEIVHPAPARQGYLSRPTLGFVIAILIVAASIRLETPYVVLAPGPARDAAKLTKIEANTFSSQGSFHLTTALLQSANGATIPEVLEAWLHPDYEILPRRLIFPPGESSKEVEKKAAQDMTESQQSALLVAMTELGMPPEVRGARIVSIRLKVPAAKVLEPGDVIVAINRQPVRTTTDIGPIVQGVAVGAKVDVEVRRGEETKSFSFPTVESEDEKGKPVLGVVVTPDLVFPVKVSIDAGDIGGPSAGLIFALTIYDQLVSEDLTGGRVIAGTGVLTLEGKVTKVGGIEQKIKGAEQIKASIFICPKEDLTEAREVAPRGMRVIGVGSLQEAISALRALR